MADRRRDRLGRPLPPGADPHAHATGPVGVDVVTVEAVGEDVHVVGRVRYAQDEGEER